jgi:hypothetical protein
MTAMGTNRLREAFEGRCAITLKGLMRRATVAVFIVLLWARPMSARFVQFGEKVVGAGAVGAALQGTSIGLSADANIAIVGGCGDSSYSGAAWVFTRHSGVWAYNNKLVGTGAVGLANQGVSVALSADGSRAIVGGSDDNGQVGAAWIFSYNTLTFNQEGSKLVGTGALGASRQGTAVALSADGNTAIVGGASDYSNTGAAWVFVRSGGVWAQQGSKLVGTGGAGTPMQGQSVALSGDGNTALVGGYRDSSYTGAAWVFTRSAGVWTQQGAKLVGTGVGVIGTAGSRQGTSLALSGDGATAVVEAQSDNNWDGAAWVFVPLCARGLANTTIATTQVFISCGTLTAGPAFRVESPGDVTLRAAIRVSLANGFSVGPGATFKAGLDPSLAL